MKRATILLFCILCYAILTLWIEYRWAWAIFQLSCFALAAWRLLSPRIIRMRFVWLPLALAVLWPAVQVVGGLTVSYERTSEEALNWFTFFVVFALTCECATDARASRWLVPAMTLFGMIMAAVSIVQTYSSGGRIFWLFPSGYDAGVLGPFVNRNQFAAWIELLLPMALYLAGTEHQRRDLYICAAAVLFSALIASASRAGFVLGCLEILTAFTMLAIRRAASLRHPVRMAIGLVLISLIGGTVVGWGGLLDRFVTPGSERLRMDAVLASLRMVRDRPWSGTGIGTWAMVYPRYASFDSGLFMNQAHNDWLQWAAEGGVPFVLVMVLFAGTLCKAAIPSIYGLGTVAFLLHALVDYPMQLRPGLAAWFFAIAGVVMATRIRHPNAHDELLRRTRPRPQSIARADSPRVQASRITASSGPL